MMSDNVSKFDKSLPRPAKYSYLGNVDDHKANLVKKAAAFSKTPLPRPIRSARPLPVSQIIEPESKAANGQQSAYTPIISVKGLRQTHKYKASRFTLSIPLLEIYPGELIYIGGEAGSGKSTLIKLMALETVPKEGEIWIYYENVAKLTPHERDDLRGDCILYLPQRHLGLTTLPPLENIRRFLLDYHCFDRDEATRMASEALITVGFAEKDFHKSFKLLSGGERARIAAAKVYATKRPICLADEIFASLDPKSRLEILRIFQKLASQGYTVVIIAHHPELQQYFPRVIEFAKGKMITDFCHIHVKLQTL